MIELRSATGLSAGDDPVAAAEAACRDAAAIVGDECDFAVLFCSAAFVDAAVDVAQIALKTLSPGALIGVSGGTVVGGSREVEDTPAVSVWAARLPETSVQAFAMEYEQTPDGNAFPGWPDGVEAGDGVILFADPYTFPVDDWLRRLNEADPGLLVIGGMASGGAGPGSHRLWWNHEVRNGGAVGAIVKGRVNVRALVSQGCRPIGDPATVTRAERNVIFEMAGAPPLERVKATYAAATPEEKAMMRSGLHIGRVVDEYKTEFRRGDFLIRNVMGVDQDSGALVVGDFVGVGETVQFHVRDAASADEDLRQAVGSVDKPDAALLFTCNGRGSHLFGAPDHDATIVANAFNAPVAGFSCAGEIGPVGGKNFLHGFTASMALFYDGGSA